MLRAVGSRWSDTLRSRLAIRATRPTSSDSGWPGQVGQGRIIQVAIEVLCCTPGRNLSAQESCVVPEHEPPRGVA